MSSHPSSLEPSIGSGTGSVLLVTTCWWPSLAQFAHLLVQHHCRVSVLCPVGHAVHAVPGVTVRRHRGIDPVRALSKAIHACKPEMVVPADDRAVIHLHRLHRTGSDADRALVERSLGVADGFGVTTSRLRLLEVAQSLGIAVPEGAAMVGRPGLEAWMDRVPGPWVLKVNGAWGGDGVRITATRDATRVAFKKLARRLNIWRVLRRLVIKGDSFWVSDWMCPGALEVTAQAYVAGWPGNLTMLCHNGEVLAAIVVETVKSMGLTGPSTVVQVVERPEFVANAKLLARKLGLNGFHGLDFMVENLTGRALLIEMNPRLIQLSSVRLEPGRDLVGAAITLLLGKACAPPTTLPGKLVAYFPTAQQNGCDKAYLASCFHDVPWDQPALMAEMLRPSWPERRILSRLVSRLAP